MSFLRADKRQPKKGGLLGLTSKAPMLRCAVSWTFLPMSGRFSVPEQGINWRFFRENTEGAYTAGSLGFKVDDDIGVDFTFTTEQGTDRIIRLAFDSARKAGMNRVTAVTKANIIKTTDGMFLENFYRIAKEYPEMSVDDWFIDIMTAKLID